MRIPVVDDQTGRGNERRGINIVEELGGTHHGMLAHNATKKIWVVF